MPALPAISMAPDLPHLALFFGVGITLLLLRSLRWLYVLVVLPGTILHELTHLIMGFLLGARPAKFSIVPRRKDGGLVLGHVLFARLRWWNAAPVCMAPLLLLPGAARLALMAVQGSFESSLLASAAAWIVAVSAIMSGKDLSEGLEGPLTVLIVVAQIFALHGNTLPSSLMAQTIPTKNYARQLLGAAKLGYIKNFII
jgi:hypothetical protein